MLRCLSALALALLPGAHALSSHLRASTDLHSATGTERLDPAGSHITWKTCKTDAQWSPKADLRFIHIPRTGGTAMEFCDKEFPPFVNVTSWKPDSKKIRGKGNEADKMRGRLKVFPDLAYYHAIGLKNVRKCYVQHVPPNAFEREEPGQQIYPYGKGNNFCVVRHPYDRLISQFGFACMMYKPKWGFLYTCNKPDLNGYLMERLNKVKEGALDFEDCHFVPESTYVYGYNASTGKANPDEPWCDHMLHYERLGPEFNNLMEKFGYGLRIDGEPGKGDSTSFAMSTKGDCAKLNAADLNSTVLALANEIYKQDFELLGYKPRW